MAEDDQVDGLAEDRGSFLGLLDSFAHVGREPWCSKAPRRALVAPIIQWETARAGTIGGPEWTDVGLHAFHARLVCTSLGYREGYRPGGRGGPHFSGGPSLTA